MPPQIIYGNQSVLRTYTQPDFDVPENKKDKDWYSQSIRYYSTFYDKRPSYFNASIISEDENINSPIDTGLKNSLYLLGRQNNIDYNYITTDLSGNSLQSVWVKGK